MFYKKRMIWKLLLILIIGILFLSSCLVQKPSGVDVVGIWIEKSENNQSNDDLCPYIEFFLDGRFEAHDLPRSYFINRSKPQPRVDLQGTWELDNSSNDPFAHHKLDLTIEAITLSGSTVRIGSVLRIHGTGKNVSLYAGSIDEQIFFIKTDGLDCVDES